MNTLEAVQLYVNAKANFENRMAEAENISINLIPSAKLQFNQAEAELQAAEKLLRQAITTEQVQAAREAVNAANQAKNDLGQLHANLELRHKSWENERGQLRANMEIALRGVWELYREDLMEQFELSEDTLTTLEYLAAANNGQSPFGGSLLIAEPIIDKYGRSISPERNEEIQNSVLENLISQLP